MNDESDEIKRWTARRKASVVMDIIKGNKMRRLTPTRSDIEGRLRLNGLFHANQQKLGCAIIK